MGECSYVTVSETELTQNPPFCPLPCSRWHVLYFEARPQSFLSCVGWVHRFAVISGVSSGARLPDVAGKQVAVGRFVPTNSKRLEGDLSQNGTSGRATVFALMNA